MNNSPESSDDPAPPGAAKKNRRELTTQEYVSGVRAGDPVVLGRALTLIESSLPRHEEASEQLLAQLMPFTGGAIRVGITGPPGVGKSTFIEALGMRLIERGHKVAVLAVDPSSGISGGSILGDKTRMVRLASHSDAFVRPSPSAGTLGGVARKTRESLLVCEAANFDVVLVETVGTGQSETMVADMTDCFVALLLPGSGDELQGIKRGLLELVDIIAVNKADGEWKSAAELAAHRYRTLLESLAQGDDERTRKSTQVFTCSALEHQVSDEQNGINVIWNEIARRHHDQQQSGQLSRRRQHQNRCWLWELVNARLLGELQSHPAVVAIRDELESDVEAGKVPAESAARQILTAFRGDP